jgi:hypothetical protein
MSSGLSNKKSEDYEIISQSITNLFENTPQESFLGISEAIVSFLSLSNKKSQKNYKDSKDLPFKDTDSQIKQIMKEEFIDAIRSLKNRIS